MRKYLEFAKAAMKEQTAYTAWFWAGTATTILQLLIMYYFWHAVYANRTEVATMPLQTMLTYMVVAMFLGEYVSGVGSQLSQDIRTGNIAVELMRPYHLLDRLVAMDLGYKASGTLRGGLPMFLVALFFIGIELPPTMEAGMLFVFSAVLGILLGTQIDLIIGVVAFWTINTWGLQTFKDSLMRFFSGALIPISLFPAWFQTMSRFLPFQSMVFVPVSIYTGTISGIEAYGAITIQFCWLIFSILAVRLIWMLAVRKVTILGG